ncbi:hypothetical protein OJAV_G00039440 [Oryzias javanicus]|uniref:HMG domain-containing protein n=1 Tax=Oryzias javanicus TaxID=123683 RepID=A0A437DCM4_ORYJA|nr:hypothetical protein OJAV_G00039440 [Oryzias javanicus]
MHMFAIRPYTTLEKEEEEEELPLPARSEVTPAILSAAERKMHVSNLKKGGRLEHKPLAFGFGCPLCTTFKTLSEEVIKRHLGNHIATAVHFRDYIICRCNLPCRVGGHFHCPFCYNTIIRKTCLPSHLTVCKKRTDLVKSVVLAYYAPFSPESQPSLDCSVSSVGSEHSYSLVPPESSETFDHSYAQGAPPETPTVPTDIGQQTSASKSDQEATAQRAPTDYSKHLSPDETTCQLCPDHPKLLELTLVTSNARIVGMQGVNQNVSTYNKRCPKCKLVYRYQEWRDGLHNFNDNIILTLQLCVYLRHNLKSGVSVSRVINSLEILLKVDFPATDLIFQGYCHFEALSNTENKSYPPSGVAKKRKRRSSLEASDPEQPDGEFHGENNMVSFWESLRLRMISQGFFEFLLQNPFVVSPTNGTWTPWFGTKTHKDNTDMEKAPLQRSIAEAHLDDENMAEKAFDNKRVCMADPIKFCVFQTSQNTGQQ